MKKFRYTDSQILAILKQADSGISVPDLCREHGMSSAMFYKWRANFLAKLLREGRVDGRGAQRRKDLKMRMAKKFFLVLKFMQVDTIWAP